MALNNLEQMDLQGKDDVETYAQIEALKLAFEDGNTYVVIHLTKKLKLI